MKSQNILVIGGKGKTGSRVAQSLNNMGHTVRMVELPSNTIAVDRPEDIALVEAALHAD